MGLSDGKGTFDFHISHIALDIGHVINDAVLIHILQQYGNTAAIELAVVVLDQDAVAAFILQRAIAYRFKSTAQSIELVVLFLDLAVRIQVTTHIVYLIQATVILQADPQLRVAFFIDPDLYDMIIGYRADDSYFTFAQDFVSGTISLPFTR